MRHVQERRTHKIEEKQTCCESACNGCAEKSEQLHLVVAFLHVLHDFLIKQVRKLKARLETATHLMESMVRTKTHTVYVGAEQGQGVSEHDGGSKGGEAPCQ